MSAEYSFDLQAELDRKSIEALGELMRMHENGEISHEAYRIGLLTVNLVTRGLIDAQVIEALDAERQAAPTDDPTDTRILRDSSRVLALSRALTDAEVKVLIIEDGSIKEQCLVNNGVCPEIEAAERMDEIEQKALAKGMERVI